MTVSFIFVTLMFDSGVRVISWGLRGLMLIRDYHDRDED